MACWNDKRQGDTLMVCIVCGANVSKKRRTYHLIDCWARNKVHLENQIRKCPLNPSHLIPTVHLNHHLEGNCEEAQNALRRYFHRPELRSEMKDPPAQFLAHVPEDILNAHNRKLLFLLRKDLDGQDIADNKDLYPDPSTETRQPPEAGPGPAPTPAATQ